MEFNVGDKYIQVGDIVVTHRAVGPIVWGKRYTVVRITPGDIFIVCDGGYEEGWAPENFEVVEPAKPCEMSGAEEYNEIIAAQELMEKDLC